MVVPRFGLPLAALALALALCVAAAVATRTAERGGVARPWRGWGHSGTAPRELPEDTRVEVRAAGRPDAWAQRAASADGCNGAY
jgi:hypothetical protein